MATQRDAAQLMHATCVAYAAPDQGRNATLGVLLCGPSGAGKSDLAIRLIDRGWHLVADDQCEIACRDGQLMARSPDSIAGKIEVRGLGISELPHLTEVPVGLIVELCPADQVERLPEQPDQDIMGVRVRKCALSAFEASTPIKLQMALDEAARRAGAAGRSSAGASAGPLPRSAGRAPAPPARDEPETGARGGRSGRAGQARRLILVSGLSGAGRSTALNFLADLGYESIDNLPLELIEPSLALGGSGPLALGVDIRSRNFSVAPFLERVALLRANPAFQVSLLFLECDDEVLLRRYTETRRRHPLALDRPLIDGILAERRLVAPLRDGADLVIDTSSLTQGDLRQLLKGQLDPETVPGMAILVMSFSYRRGLPRAADLVFDVRFLKNPHYEPELRELTGRDRSVAAFIREDRDFAPFFERLTGMLLPLLARYQDEGKSYLTIAFGCTGGQHRSVMLAETLAAELEAQNWQATLLHRDVDRTKIGRASTSDSA